MPLILRIENMTTLPDGGPISVTLDRRGIDIGRDTYLDWTLPDPDRFISGKHAEVRYRDGGYWLHDVSTNGTSVNSEYGRIKEPHRLADGDRIHIGRYIVAVSLSGEAAAPAFGAPAASAAAASADPWGGVEGAAEAGSRRDFQSRASEKPRYAAGGEDIADADFSWSVGAVTPGTGGGADWAAPRPAPTVADGGSVWGAPAAAPAAGWTPPPAADDWLTPPPAAERASPAPAPAAPGADWRVAPPPPEAPAADWRAAPPPPKAPAADWRVAPPPPEAPAGDWRAAPPPPEAPAADWRAAPPPPEAPAADWRVAPPPPEAPTAAWEAPSAAPAVIPAPSPAPRGLASQWTEAPEAAPVPDTPAPAPAARAGSGDWVAAFERGAGLPPGAVAGGGDAMAEELGALMRLVAENLQQMLIGRAETKGAMRSSNRTMIAAMENNPLKFSPSPEDALRIMFGQKTRSYLDARQTLTASFGDLKSHQIQTFSAMQQALGALVEDLDPAKIDAATPGEGGIASLVSSRRAKLWDMYVERFKAKSARHERGMIDAFMVLFSEMYDRQGR